MMRLIVRAMTDINPENDIRRVTLNRKQTFRWAIHSQKPPKILLIYIIEIKLCSKHAWMTRTNILLKRIYKINVVHYLIL